MPQSILVCSIFGPILFISYINNLPDCVSSTCKIFADYTKLYSFSSKSCVLQNDLNLLHCWSDVWQLQFNKKSKVLHFGANNHKLNYAMNYEETQLYNDNCSSESDLGVIFDSNLLFVDHIDKALKTANRTLGMIARTFIFLNKTNLTSLCKALVRRHLEYGNVIWYHALKDNQQLLKKSKEELLNC